MKKYLVILGALLMIAGSAFGQLTVANQDSCDISVSPAATMLLPYFSVSATGETTLVTITNVSDTPAVAHFTVWSNHSYPVLDFNVFLTGYDVQGISLTDVLFNGNVPSTGTPTTLSPEGSRSLDNVTGNPNRSVAAAPSGWAATCGINQGGTGVIPPGLLADVQSGLTGGAYQACAAIASTTPTLQGYITIDVVNLCSQDLPTTAGYFDTQILHDNQLIGDYIRIDAAGGVSGASPLVHIKSVPFGGPATGAVATGLSRTFYERYQSTNNLDVATAVTRFDRRQPLPAKFAARYIEPGTALNFDTSFTVWREGVTNRANSLVCAAGTGTANGVARNNATYVEIVRFDEQENPRTFTPEGCTISPCTTPVVRRLAESQSIGITSQYIPPDSGTTDPGGWLYMNMANPAVFAANGIATQAWVQVRMTAAGMFGVDFDAAYLSNGCSSYQGVTVGTQGGVGKIGPHIN